jgi:hypothetical protein
MEKTINKLSTISYNGQVTVKAIDGKRTLYSYKSHNTGKQKLFDFLANCLIGNFVAAKSAMPCRIACFSGKVSKDTKVSTYVYRDSSNYLDNKTDGSTEVVFRFRIPYTCLKAGTTINYFALFPDVPSDPKTDCCAEFMLADGINVPNSGGNYTILVE